MGLFDDFDIDMDEVKAASFDFEDGTYEFEIAEARRQNGSKNNPDNTFFVIHYSLNDGTAGTYQEWFTIAEDGEVTKKAQQSLGYLKARLVDLGIEPAAMNELEPEELEGISGTLQIKTTKKNGNSYQNLRNVKVGDSPVEDEPEEDDAEIKKRVAAKQAARKTSGTKAATVTKKAPAKKTTADDDDDEDNPFD